MYIMKNIYLFCKKCEKNICLYCKNGHKNHSIIHFEELLPDIKNPVII